MPISPANDGPSDFETLSSVLDAANRQEPGATEKLLPLVYNALRRLAATRLAREDPGHTLQPTALVHEAYLRVVEAGNRAERPWSGRGHFFAAAAEAMRRILVEQARRKRALKRGGQFGRQDLDPDQHAIEFAETREDILALDEALEKLRHHAPVKAELVKLRYFAGLTSEEAARALGISSASAERYWAYARAWLQVELGEGLEENPPSPAC